MGMEFIQGEREGLRRAAHCNHDLLKPSMLRRLDLPRREKQHIGNVNICGRTSKRVFPLLGGRWSQTYVLQADKRRDYAFLKLFADLILVQRRSGRSAAISCSGGWHRLSH